MRFLHHSSIFASLLVLSVFACDGKVGGPGELPERFDENPRIIGGITDQPHLYVVGVGNNGGAFCSGTVISARTVITAGHCFGGISRVFFGNNAGNPDASVAVAQEIRHPGFSNFSLANDLAILRLAQDAPVQAAPLLRDTMNNGAEFVGPELTFVGYGVNNGNTQTGFGIRRVVTFPIEAVGPANVGGTPGSINATQFYYQFPGENTCNGDSGGPAFLVRDGVEQHAGVTSFGDGPCNFDGVQARTDGPQIANFIQDRIDQFEGNNACRSNGVCNSACNTGGNVGDPDCAAQHCAADGVCSLACAAPVDPDCANLNINYCGNDGFCDPSCSNFDSDCANLCDDGTCGGNNGGNEDSCVDRCGEFDANEACQCDDQCVQFGDCCTDLDQACNAGPDPNSCADRCGVFDSGQPCQCDAQCAQFGDCCDDVNQVCQ